MEDKRMLVFDALESDPYLKERFGGTWDNLSIHQVMGNKETHDPAVENAWKEVIQLQDDARILYVIQVAGDLLTPPFPEVDEKAYVPLLSQAFQLSPDARRMLIRDLALLEQISIKFTKS